MEVYREIELEASSAMPKYLKLEVERFDEDRAQQEQQLHWCSLSSYLKFNTRF